MSDGNENPLGSPVNSKMIAVCGHCRHHEGSAIIEFNFGDSTVYWMCPSCRKMNKMDFSKPQATPYPKAKRMF